MSLADLGPPSGYVFSPEQQCVPLGPTAKSASPSWVRSDPGSATAEILEAGGELGACDPLAGEEAASQVVIV